MVSAATLSRSTLVRPSLISTENPALDGMLGGGLPQGSVVVLEGAIGRFSLLVPLLAKVTQRHMAAIVDGGELYPPGLAQAGVRLEHLLVVPAAAPLAIARAVDTLLRSHSCSTIVMPAATLRANVWARLAHLTQRSSSLLFVLTPQRASLALQHAASLHAQAIPATIRLQCSVERFLLHGERGPWRFCSGYDITVRLAKHRYIPATSTIVRAS